LKALLEAALERNVRRPVTLLFGARSQRDLYCLDALTQLQERWAIDDFKFIPVLSEEAVDSDWEGARGLVTDLLPQLAHAQHQVYMCGPPPMLDAAEACLQQQGLAADQIFSDRFLDRSTNPKLATSA
jgi:3-phenylpropionate/trans-cinnamate dioxygenase ferredoxin reductase subunit